MRKIRLGIIFGGKSVEHEVSLQSAKNIIEAVDKEKFEVVLIGIDKEGKWFLNDETKSLLASNHQELITFNHSTKEITLIPGENSVQLYSPKQQQSLGSLDVIFPVLHGPLGEDGTIQGFLKIAGIPFVGADVLGSAIGMDKDITKRLLRDAGIPVAKFLTFYKYSMDKMNFNDIKNYLGVPCFVKPANLGSSVGVKKVRDENEFKEAVMDAFQYDNKIIIEEYIKGREIECSVLGNEKPMASIPGEIIPQHDFYTYEAKYIDEKGALLDIPAKLPNEIIQNVQELAIQTFQVLNVEGMARVDFFLKENGVLIVNEINTIPGFTRISMYPKLWEESGISYQQLIDILIDLAIKRFERDNNLKKSFDM